MSRGSRSAVAGPLGAAAAVLLIAGCATAGSATGPSAEPAEDTTSANVAEASGAPTSPQQAPEQPAPSQPDTLPVVAAASAGCEVPDASLQPGATVTRTITLEGVKRNYLLHVPSGYQPGQPTAAVVALHGMGANAFLQLANSGIVNSANTNGYVVIAPNGIGGSWQLPTPGADTTASPDVDFITASVDDAAGALCLDPSRYYASGMSMGSAMSLVLACQPDRRYAAFGGVGASFYEPACGAAPPAPLIYFHGTDDDVVPFEGGTARGFEVAPVPEVMASWAAHNQCGATPAETVIADVTVLEWADCALDADVDFYQVADGGHTWPGSPVTTNPVFAEYAGATTSTVNATDGMWEFFSRYSLPTQM